MSLQDNLDAFRAFAIGRDGIIHYAEVSPDYTRRPDPSELFPILDGMRAREAA